MNYKNTLNLPKTRFSMKANLPDKEPAFLQKWDEMGLYGRIRKERSGRPVFMLHDGPPYANGSIHMGHVLNKVLKDIVIRYKTMAGFDAPFVPGWDCHGLPIEYRLLKEMGRTKHELDKLKFRKSAAEYAAKYVSIQREEFKRLGVSGDWDNPYLTMNPLYAGSIIDCFSRLYKKGFIYRGLKPILWCPVCETALAEAEVVYDNHTSPSVYVGFKVKKGLPACAGRMENVYAVIWTTTPWTLPANLAVAVRPEYTYSFVVDKNSRNVFITAKQLVSRFAEECALKDYEAIAEAKGEEFKDMVTMHPFIDRDSPVVFSPHVTLDQGTGCVHTAPGHGEEDYEVGLRYGLHPYAPVDNKGYFTKDVEHFGGMNVFEANGKIIEFMKSNNTLLASHEIEHTYPHCWRCKKPIIFRATKQWFMGIDRHNLRRKVLGLVDSVKWIPEAGQKRMAGMVSGRPDWCLSRQRLWGVAIPVFYCAGCGADLVSEEAMDRVKELVDKNGSDIWFSADAAEFLPAGIRCGECGGSVFKKEEDIIDVWFDSGISHESVLANRPGCARPADLYLEGSDQHRGWFQTSLLTSAGMKGDSPFKTVLTHGFVVDGEGKKMSKSLGNVIMPQEVLPRYGADILRLWVSSIDYRGDVPISGDILSQLADAYRKIRNTFRFILGNLYDFAPQENSVSAENLEPLDLWALGRTHKLLAGVTDAYNRYSFYEAYHAIYNFCIVDMSSFYLDILKDRLYTFAADSAGRRSAQTVLSHIADLLVRITAPLIPFTAEEVWENIPARAQKCYSVHLAEWPKTDPALARIASQPHWGQLFGVRAEVLKVLEARRREGIIGSSLEADVGLLFADTRLRDLFKEYEELLPSLFIVSKVKIKDYTAEGPESVEALPASSVWGLYILVKKVSGRKCARCWNWDDEAGMDSRYPDVCKRCAAVVAEQINK